MGCCSSTTEVEYLNGRPTFQASTVVKCFDRENGLLFRLVNSKRQWAYYNDTTEYEMHIKVTFNKDCDIKALGKTTLERLDDGDYVASIIVHPRQTELFIEGHVNGFKSKMDAIPVSGGQQE